MKKAIAVAAVFVFLTAAIPFVGLLIPRSVQNTPPPAQSPEAPAQQQEEMTFQILDNVTGQVNEVSARDFVRGAVMAEMPAAYDGQALRAQAVAAYSYALALRAQNADGHDETLKGADFSASPSLKLGYMTEDMARSYWGTAFEANWAKICSAVDEVMPTVLLWENQPACACYHAISNGQTESAENVWLTALPYLTSVDSHWDEAAEGYEFITELTPQQVYDALALKLAGIDLSGDPSRWFGAIKHTQAGYVAQIKVGGINAKGTDVRALLGLRSACFTVEYTDKLFRFVTRGYGHGVGLSQCGANAMAQEGSTWQEILAHYYPGTTLGYWDEESAQAAAPAQ